MDKITNNYINGNITDFKNDLKVATKKELLFIIIGLAEYLSIKNDYENRTYSDNGYSAALEVINKYI